ncbi:hypothetical protein GCM10023074_15620 [Microbispora amethystogenes]|uniref:Uncharacterized protein n=1 Tax=Microbispora amethystogenes TaxID=1427754 RepID=A0ABQ4F7C7_9ACTN|nr:hypothetical protein Mam01_08790 [Microbispora amethystogenes]
MAVSSDITGFFVSTTADCQSDHGPFTPVVVTARTRHRTCQPSVNFPEGTDTDAVGVSKVVEVVPVPDQISPDPCVGTEGSCSTSAPRYERLENVGSEIFPWNVGVNDDNVQNPELFVPVAQSSDTEGLLTSTFADCQSDHCPATPVVVTPRTRHRTSQPSASFPEGTLTSVVDPDAADVVPVPEEIRPLP